MPRTRHAALVGEALLTVLALTALSNAAMAAQYNVYSDADLAPLLRHDWNNPSVGLQAGDEVILHGGNYNNLMTISAQGTLANPIRIHALTNDPSGPPIIHNSIVFQASQHVIVDGVHVTGCPTYDGVNFNVGATANTITNSDVSSCRQGIVVWGYDPNNPSIAAGPSNVISLNNVHDNSLDGIYAVGAQNVNGTLIQGNQVHNNGKDGIMVTASNTVIEYNISYANGQGAIGTSGIRVYGGAPNYPSGYGANNIIRYNLVYGQSDHGGPTDGSGIDLDTYVTNNQVYFNEAHGNDGGGILLWASESNWVFNNTLYQNGRNTARGAADFEIGGGAALKSNDGRFSGNSLNNIIANNLISSVGTSPSFAVEINSTQNTFSNQMYVPKQDGTVNLSVYTLGGASTTYTSIAAWNTAKGGTPDIAANPLFVNSSAVTPTSGLSKNLSLQSVQSPAYRAGVSPLTLPNPVTVTVDLWQGFNNPGTSNIDPNHPPIGAYTVDP